MTNWLITTTLALLLLNSASAPAALPQELDAFFPAKYRPIRAVGMTSDRAKCRVQIERYHDGALAAGVIVFDRSGRADRRRSEQFQIGLGYYFIGFETSASGFTAQSYHEADELFEPDLRSTLRVGKVAGRIKAVQVISEEKVFGAYRTLVDETCFFAHRRQHGGLIPFNDRL